MHAELAPRLVGAPAGNIAELLASAWVTPPTLAQAVQRHHLGRLRCSATSALDLAAGDLRARALGLPLHEALGGRVRDAIRVYVPPHRRSRPPASTGRPAPRARRGGRLGPGRHAGERAPRLDQLARAPRRAGARAGRRRVHRAQALPLRAAGRGHRWPVDHARPAGREPPAVSRRARGGGRAPGPGRRPGLEHVDARPGASDRARALSDFELYVARGSAAHLRARIHRAAEPRDDDAAGRLRLSLRPAELRRHDRTQRRLARTNGPGVGSGA